MVTIVLPVYNARPYIGDCLQSILRQTWADWELSLFDDGSTDGTLELLEDFCAGEPRAVLYRRRQSYVDNLNEGLRTARGTYIARMDADDVMMPTRLAEQVRYLEEHPGVALAASQAVIFDGTGEDLWSPPIVGAPVGADDMLFVNHIIHPSVMMRREVVLGRALFYDPAYLYAEDLELWVRYLEAGLGMVVMPVPLVRYRKHAGSMSLSHYGRIQELKPDINGRLMALMARKRRRGE